MNGNTLIEFVGVFICMPLAISLVVSGITYIYKGKTQIKAVPISFVISLLLIIVYKQFG